ncbi:ATPase [Sulfuracidifex metallicus]|jgi:ATP synthase epsilon subunit.|uniref:ATPase n=1 Tax=Sulfuracidifex metallicus DSM 6482 = JCM 9184 TaxID=523847 RepID=A0A6A9QLK2_SULME|nr:ATPase [Sulfuracidifex metallicus]MUN28115.1 ATPase [Sulfuracidifex metallicus DSM 6482 = JCM 9184]WOE51343.1 ATPase [Sulfuracidifex metallicus DSM 6482 = JCM 9184]
MQEYENLKKSLSLSLEQKKNEILQNLTKQYDEISSKRKAQLEELGRKVLKELS